MPDTVFLNAYALHRWQTCRRRYAIELKYRYRRWKPTHLLASVTRRALFELSRGIVSVESISRDAVTRFIACAKHPGLECPSGTDTYKLAMDLCATIRTIIEYMSRATLLTLHDRAAVLFPSTVLDAPFDITWDYLAHFDESGILHRWEFVDYISRDDIITRLHSWEVFADIAIAQSPMMLHFISIGRTEKSRRISPWCRAYTSPAIMNMMKFQRKSGQALTENWKPVWLAEKTAQSASSWVDQMLDDNACDDLIKHVHVKEPDPKHAQDFKAHLLYEARQIHESDAQTAKFNPFDLPLSRPHCDTPSICPHQLVCFTNTSIEESGLYDIKAI